MVRVRTVNTLLCATLLCTISCRDRKREEITPEAPSISLSLSTPLAQWMQRETNEMLRELSPRMIPLTDKQTSEMAPGGVRTPEYWSTYAFFEDKEKVELFLAYRAFFTNFQKSRWKNSPLKGAYIPWSVYSLFCDEQGLPQEVTIELLRRILIETDAAEQEADRIYNTMDVSKLVYPSPEERRAMANEAPLAFSAITMLSVANMVGTAEHILPKEHTEIVTRVVQSKEYRTSYGVLFRGMFNGSSTDPRTGKMDTNIVFLSLFTIGFDGEEGEGTATLIHEIGHAVDESIHNSSAFYKISWKEPVWRMEKNPTPRWWPQENGWPEGFVSWYARSGGWIEDFAETYSTYVVSADRFRRIIRKEWREADPTWEASTPQQREIVEIPLFQKYHFMWELFGRKEYGSVGEEWKEISPHLFEMPPIILPTAR